MDAMIALIRCAYFHRDDRGHHQDENASEIKLDTNVGVMQGKTLEEEIRAVLVPFPQRRLSQMLVRVARTLADEIHGVLLIPDELAEPHHRVHGGLRDDLVGVVEHRRRHHRHGGARSKKTGLAGSLHPAVRSMELLRWGRG